MHARPTCPSASPTSPPRPASSFRKLRCRRPRTTSSTPPATASRLFDYDNDGDLDVLIVNGSTCERLPAGGDPMVALYRNDGAASSPTSPRPQRPHPSRMGHGRLRRRLRQRRLRGRLRDRVRTERAVAEQRRPARSRRPRQAGGPAWSTGCAFGDYDRDGYVDLYVANYVRFERGQSRRARAGTCRFMNIDVACGPRPLTGEPDGCIATSAAAGQVHGRRRDAARGHHRSRLLRLRRAVHRSGRRRLAGYLRGERLDAEPVLPQPARRHVHGSRACSRDSP